MNTPTHSELVEQVRARRKLPLPSDRRRIREEAALSLRAIGGALGVSHTAVASWEAGRVPRRHSEAYAQLLRDLETAMHP